MNKKQHQAFHKLAHHLPLVLIMSWLILVFPIYIPNMGGAGLKLPFNIITWSMMAAVVAIIWIQSPFHKTFVWGTTTRFFVLGVIIMAFPLFYTRSEWLDVAGSRYAALIGGMLFTVSLRQCSLIREKTTWLFSALLFAITLQALIATAQLFAVHLVPNFFAYPTLNNRPYGVFQQVNLLASFIATGLALALVMFFLPIRPPTHHQKTSIISAILAAMLVLFTALLVWLQSRIGWLGGGVAALALMSLGCKSAPKKTALSAGFMGLGLVLAMIVMWQGALPSVTHEGSDHARITMLRDTIRMYLDKPFFGWGYGGFEYSFQHFRAAQNLSTLGLGVVRHPHNEILLWLVEGGIVALCGMLLLAGAGAYTFWRALHMFLPSKRSGKKSYPLPMAVMCILIPILLHTQTEYPFTASAPHWAIFLILTAILASQLKITPLIPPPPRRILWLKMPIIALSLFGVVLFSQGLYANLVLTAEESHQLQRIDLAQSVMKYDPWVNRERWLYDKHLHDLLIFNKTQNIKSLYQYQSWAEHYLLFRIDRNVYGNLVGVLAFLKEESKYKQIKQEAFIMFPDDKRFYTE